MNRNLSALLLLASGSAYAGDCSQLDAYAAETVVDYLDSWENVHLAYKQFARRDDGGAAEGYSDRIVHLLATKWSALPELASYTDADPAFRAFVFKHIDATTDWSEVKKISVLASTQCPQKLAPLCSGLNKAIDIVAKDAHAK